MIEMGKLSYLILTGLAVAFPLVEVVAIAKAKAPPTVKVSEEPVIFYGPPQATYDGTLGRYVRAPTQ